LERTCIFKIGCILNCFKNCDISFILLIFFLKSKKLKLQNIIKSCVEPVFFKKKIISAKKCWTWVQGTAMSPIDILEREAPSLHDSSSHWLHGGTYQAWRIGWIFFEKIGGEFVELTHQPGTGFKILCNLLGQEALIRGLVPSLSNWVLYGEKSY